MTGGDYYRGYCLSGVSFGIKESKRTGTQSVFIFIALLLSLSPPPFLSPCPSSMFLPQELERVTAELKTLTKDIQKFSNNTQHPPLSNEGKVRECVYTCTCMQSLILLLLIHSRAVYCRGGSKCTVILKIFNKLTSSSQHLHPQQVNNNTLIHVWTSFLSLSLSRVFFSSSC